MLKKRSHSDGVIVREVLKGDRERFDGLVERHLPAVYATALAHTRNSADAEDVVQDTFLNAFTALDRLRSPGRFGPWVITIARNTALKHLRRKKVTGETAEETSGGESPLSSAQRKEFGVFLSEAIAELPEGHREAILLHYFSGKSAREVARTLGISRSAVLKRLERGRARLGKHLLDRMGDEETVRDALRPSIHRVTRSIAAAAVTWEASKSLTAGSVLAASLSVLPKAGTVAACLAGMGFMAVVGWNYLKGDAVEQVEAVPEPVQAIFVAADTSQEEAQAAEEPAETAPEVEEPTEVEAEAEIARDESEEEDAEEEPTPQLVVQPSETVEASKVDFDAVMQSRVGVVFEDIHLYGITEFLSETYKFPILIDAGAVFIPDASQAAEEIERLSAEDENDGEREYFTDGIFETIDMRDMMLFEILDELTSALGLSYVSEPGFIWISTRSLIATEVKREPDARFDVYDNEERARQKAGVVFNDIHLADVLDFISDTYEVNLALDYRVVQLSEKSARPREIPQGYVTDGMISYINMKNIELRDVLKVILRPLNLSFAVRDNAVVISSAERLAQSDSLNESLMTPDAMGNRMKAYRNAIQELQKIASTG